MGTTEIKPKSSIIVCNAYPKFNYNSSIYKNNLFVGTELPENEGAGSYCTFLTFDLSKIPANAIIESVKLKLYVCSIYSITPINNTVIDIYYSFIPYDVTAINWESLPDHDPDITNISIKGQKPNPPHVIFNSLNIPLNIKPFDSWIQHCPSNFTMILRKDNSYLVNISNMIPNQPSLQVTYIISNSSTTIPAVDESNLPLTFKPLNNENTESVPVKFQNSICFELTCSSLTPKPSNTSISSNGYFPVTITLQVTNSKTLNNTTNWFPVKSCQITDINQKSILFTSSPTLFARVVLSDPNHLNDINALNDVSIAVSAYTRI